MQRLISNIAQIPGWRTKRKIVVIESDDWGSIRMSSKAAIKILMKKGHNFDKDLYGNYDGLASEEDLMALFEVLDSVRDKKGNPAILTANAIMANPDFEKIRKSNFQRYYYEIFTDTLKKYPKHRNSFKLWKEGMKNKIFHPQFHGREHVNIFRWLSVLQKDDELMKAAFNEGVYGLKQINNSNARNSFMRALDYENTSQFELIRESLIEGLKIFKEKIGYDSKSFIAPSYVWSSDIEEILFGKGVKYIQGINYQYIPKLGKEELQKKWHYTGQQNVHGQRYLIRSAFFEPTLLGRTYLVENILKNINIAFFWKKPAIIGSHRINYIGYLDEKNRDQNLKLLKVLLRRIINLWPDVEFMSSDQLGLLINK